MKLHREASQEGTVKFLMSKILCWIYWITRTKWVWTFFVSQNISLQRQRTKIHFFLVSIFTWTQLNNEENTPELHKRAAPSSAFFGVRGRRQDRPSGFLGVRGKKNDNYDYSSEDELNPTYNDNDFILFDEYFEEQHGKRKPQGFVGLRGKKSEEETPDFVPQKRVPVTSFFGIGARGKKEPLTNVSCKILFDQRKHVLMMFWCFSLWFRIFRITTGLQNFSVSGRSPRIHTWSSWESVERR